MSDVSDAEFFNFGALLRGPMKLVLKYPTMKYRKSNNTIEFKNGYWVDLDPIHGSGNPWHFADWCCHLEDKAWMTDEMLGQFIRLVKDAYRDRHGRDMRDSWKRG